MTTEALAEGLPAAGIPPEDARVAASHVDDRMKECILRLYRSAVNVGEEIVVGAELWLDGSGSGIGGAVSIGVGLALQLAADKQNRAITMAPSRMGMMLSSGTTARDALNWIMRKVEQGVAAAGSDVSAPSLYRLGSSSGTFISAWEAGFGLTSFLAPTNAFFAALPTLARETGVTLSIGPALDTPVFGAGVGQPLAAIAGVRG